MYVMVRSRCQVSFPISEPPTRWNQTLRGRSRLKRAMNVQRDARGFNELRKMHSPFFDSRPLRDQALTQLHDRL